MAYFPMFIDLSDKKCLIIGGGNIAFHKAQILLDFGADVTIVAEQVGEELNELSQEAGSKIHIINKKYENSDCYGKTLVVSATNDKELNHNVAQYCHSMNIPVNTVDQREDCSFIFPSYVKEDSLVAAFSSGGNSPLITQILKEQEREILTPQLGHVNEILGSMRSLVQAQIASTDIQRRIYRRIYDEMIETGKDITEERVQEIIDNEL